MKKIMCAICLFVPLSGFAHENADLAKHYFSESVPALSQQEQHALKLTKRCQVGAKTSKPFASTGG